MNTLERRLINSAALAGVVVSTLLLASCGQTAKPSPTDAALNTPEGAAEKAPAKPSELKPPPLPPEPGHLGRN